ncbi:MAG: ABC transporter ATP-binding protein [Verrucomicrobiae bacterium]|nr:ABC transporter ATP-binding protein [Verrucomicrobiae bacterium]
MNPPLPSQESNAPAILECRRVSFSYGRSPVLEDVSFTLHRGESLCVIGPNGGGKSTLARLVLGLLEPVKGSITVLGKSPREARTSVGYVPQAMRFDPQFPISALDIVLMGRLDRIRFGRFSKQCREVAETALADVGLSGYGKRPFSALSGGERQRVMVARALACEPEVLLLDEPTANIDLTIEAQLIETLASLRHRMSILMITHDLDLVSSIGDSVLCVNHRVHRHSLPLSGETIKEIYSGRRRLEHDRRTRHQQGDHSACKHD